MKQIHILCAVQGSDNGQCGKSNKEMKMDQTDIGRRRQQDKACNARYSYLPLV